MGKKKLRNITVDGMKYLWRFMPGYDKLGQYEYQSHDVLKIYEHSQKNTYLEIHFVTWEDPIDGGPLRTGLPIVLGKAETGGVNLHQPRITADIIRHVREKYGWQPEKAGSKPLIIEDGLPILAGIGFEVE